MAKLNIDEAALFGPYLSKDDLRPQLATPFQQDGFVCATDAYALLRVRRDLLKGEYPERDNPAVSKILTPWNCGDIYSLKQIEEAIAKCPAEEEEEYVRGETDCPECDGEGKVKWEYTDSRGHTHHKYHECPVCDGSGIGEEAVYRKTGRMVVTPEAAVDVGGVNLYASRLSPLASSMRLLGVERVRHTAKYQDRVNAFQLADGVQFVCAGVGECTVCASMRPMGT